MALPKTNATVLPGHILSTFRLKQLRMAEDFFAGRALQVAGAAGVSQSQVVADHIISAAMRVIAAGLYSYGSDGFKSQTVLPTSLPFLLWVCLTIENPKVTQDEAAALITDENESALTRAVLEMLGYSFPNVVTEAGKPPAEPSNPTNPSPGTTLSKDSAAGS